MLDDASRRWVAVRSVGSSPSVRNGRMSGVRMAWACRLLARATNCKLSILFMISPSTTFVLWVGSVSCVAYQRNGIVPSRSCLLPLGSLRAVERTTSWPRVPGMPRIDVRLPWPMGLRSFSRIRIVMCGRGATRPPFVRVTHSSVLTRTTAALVLLALESHGSARSHAGVGVVKEMLPG